MADEPVTIGPPSLDRDRVLNMRAAWLVLVAIVAGALLGYSALYVDSIVHRHLGRQDIALDGLSMLVGGLVGFVSVFFVPVLLYRRNLRIALPVVYGCTLAAVASTSAVISPFLAPFIGLATLFIVAVVACVALPDMLPRRRDGRCARCRYDLRGLASAVCPECGTARPAASARRGALVELGVVPLRRLMLGTRERRWSLAVVAVLFVAIAAARYVVPHFSPDRFERIRAGMTEAEVAAILGPPHAILSGRWQYYDELFVSFDEYTVEFVDGHVARVDGMID